MCRSEHERGCDSTPYADCEARCAASHASLIQPRSAPSTAPRTRILAIIAVATKTTTIPTNSIWFGLSQSSHFRTALSVRLCTASCCRVARRDRRPQRSCRAEGWTMRVSLERATIVGHPCCLRRISHQHRTAAQHIAAGHELPRPIASRAAVIAHHRGEKRGRAVPFMAVWTASARTRQGRVHLR